MTGPNDAPLVPGADHEISRIEMVYSDVVQEWQLYFATPEAQRFDDPEGRQRLLEADVAMRGIPRFLAYDLCQNAQLEALFSDK